MGRRGPKPREAVQLPPDLRRGLKTRRGYVDALIWELDQSPSSTARTKLLDLIGRVLGHMQPAMPKRTPSVPTDPRAYLVWMRARVRRAMMAHPDKTARLVGQDKELTAAIDAMEPKEEPTPAEILEILVAELPRFSDAELLACHAEGLRRGIPGFVERG